MLCLGLKRDKEVCFCSTGLDFRDEHGSGLKPILAGSGLDRTAVLLKLVEHDRKRLRKFWLFKC